MTKILMAASEVLPFSKTGGLADVAYALSKELALKKSNEVVVITPYYKSIDLSKYEASKVDEFDLHMNWRTFHTEVYFVTYKNIKYYLLKNADKFDRDSIYGYYDDGERFAYFCDAILEFIMRQHMDFDVIHVHDWQSAMIPCIIKRRIDITNRFEKTKTILTIHNPAFQGLFGVGSLWDFYGLDENLFYSGEIRMNDQVSTLKAGIRFADKITTVSPTHANELKELEKSFGLYYDLQYRGSDFVGVLNGMDYEEFNPATDPRIDANFGLKNLTSGKKANKEAFAKEFGINVKAPLFGCVSRLSDQKGLHQLIDMSNHIIEKGGSVAILGTGEKWAEDLFNDMHKRFPTQFLAFTKFDNNLAHKIYAASDFFLMPSVFEPCGLGQMIAERYGSLPVVRSVGGLVDSVIGYTTDLNNAENATGVMFNDGDGTASNWAIDTCYHIYENSKLLTQLRKNAMKMDHSWKKSCSDYEALYKEMLAK